MNLMNRTCEVLYKQLLTAKQISDDIGDNKLNMFLSWSTEINSIIKELYDNEDLYNLARFYEIIGIFDTNLDLLSESVYYATTFQCCSCYYYASGKKELARLTAKRNYMHQIDEYKKRNHTIENYTFEELLQEKKEDEKKKYCETVGVKIYEFAECGLYLELLGDICLFIDHSLARKYYDKSKKIYNRIIKIEQANLMYVTSQHSWWTPQNHYYPTLLLCFNLNLYELDDADCIQRIELKEKLFDTINL
jgi:hypothetical protein